jgi:hypothetical protein
VVTSSLSNEDLDGFTTGESEITNHSRTSTT